MVKRGYLRTLEAVIAIVIVLIFIFSFGISNIGTGEVTPKNVKDAQKFIFKTVLSNETLRDGVLNDDTSLLDPVVSRNLPLGYNYKIQFCKSADCPIPLLPSETIYIDTVFVGEENNFRVLKLFVWEE
ncbi:MAG TPA: hypothetical protein VJJ53_03230 [Candidatus Nanoarchaeia archaeon]|nr:hypothetical protein [Candidatus Nanoarchaeia archaeon]